MNKLEVANLIENYVERLEQSVFGYVDSCAASTDEKYYKRDADISKELYDEIVDIIVEIDQNKEYASVKASITVEQLDNLYDLLRDGNRIYDLASFDELEYASELLSNNVEAYDEHLNDASQEASDQAHEELERLANIAEWDVKKLIDILNDIASKLKE